MARNTLLSTLTLVLTAPASQAFSNVVIPRAFHVESHGSRAAIHQALKSSVSPDSFEEISGEPATDMTIPYTQEAQRSLPQGLILASAIASAAAVAALATNDVSSLTAIPTDLLHSYERTLEMAPIATKAVTSASVYALGDVIAQRTEGGADVDYARTTRSLLAGLIGHGPLSHFWYQLCDGFFENTLHLTAWWAFLPKIAIDQTLWGPFWNNCYIVLLGLMKMEAPETIWGDIKRTTVPLVVSGLKLWPLAHCVTYGLVPVELRLLWVDAVEIVWVTILATAATASKADTTDNSVDALATATVHTN